MKKQIFGVCVLAGSLVCGAGTTSYWPFGSQGVRDVHGGNDLVADGGVTFVDGAARFDGKATCATSLPLDLRTCREGFTVEFWMRIPADAPAGCMMVLEQSSDSSLLENAGAFYVNVDETATSKLRSMFKTRQRCHIDEVLGVSLRDGVWHHVAFVYETAAKGDALCRLYLDGAEQAQNRAYADTAAAPLRRARLYFGSRANEKFRFAGDLDDVRISAAPLAPSRFLKARTEEQGPVKKLTVVEMSQPRAGPRPPERAKLIPLPFGSITSTGWIQTLLERSKAGMGGHFGEFDPDQFEKPYATRDYDSTIPGCKQWGSGANPGWCAEMAGEYRLGQIMLAGALNDPELLEKFEAWREAAFALQEPDGYLGAYKKTDNRLEDYNAWGCHFVYRAFLLDYERTGDRRILDAVHRGLLWFTRTWDGDNKTRYVAPTIIWPMVAVYRLTGDARLLAFCEDYAEWLNAYPSWRPHTATFAPVSSTGCFDAFSLEEGAYHVVAYAVRAQLPGILSLANGDDFPKAKSLRAYSMHLNRMGWQATYAPSSERERTGPAGCVRVTEYCNFLNWMEYMQVLARLTGESRFGDMIERMTFNAAMGARKKDERAMAYDSSPNQFLATKTSDLGGCEPYYQAYTPCLFAACCPAQSIRLLPSYLAKAVMKTPTGDLAVNTYGPCRVKTPDGVSLDIETLYPFEDTVRIRVSAEKPWSGTLRLRCPVWAKGCSVTKNGKACATEAKDGWLVVEGPWQREDIAVTFKAEPVVRAVREVYQAEPLRVVERGPLVFTQPLKEKWTEVEANEKSRPLPTGWPWFDVTCAEKPDLWAMPFATAYGTAEIRVKRTPNADYPWENPPIRLEVPMIRATRAYPPNPEKGPHNVAPCNPVPADDGAKVELVEFVPFGATNLRITCFPVAIQKQ